MPSVWRAGSVDSPAFAINGLLAAFAEATLYAPWPQSLRSAPARSLPARRLAAAGRSEMGSVLSPIRCAQSPKAPLDKPESIVLCAEQTSWARILAVPQGP